MKKALLSLLTVAVVALTGCATSTIQHVERPDVTKPISKTESLVQLKREDRFFGSALSLNVFANDTLIGELANGGELVWRAKPDFIECVSADARSSLVTTMLHGIKLDSTPLPYKCFMTKPQEILKLKYDLLYPNIRAVQPIAFLPIFKDVDRSKNVTPISIKTITSSLATETSADLKNMLEAAMKKLFGDRLIESSRKTIDLEILDYKTGSAALRWLGSSHEGSTLLKVKATIMEGSVVTDVFITRPVVSFGGFYTVGADSYIFEEVAEDIYLHMFEPSRE